VSSFDFAIVASSVDLDQKLNLGPRHLEFVLAEKLGEFAIKLIGLITKEGDIQSLELLEKRVPKNCAPAPQCEAYYRSLLPAFF
jgi:hypothetical protein